MFASPSNVPNSTQPFAARSFHRVDLDPGRWGLLKDECWISCGLCPPQVSMQWCTKSAPLF